MYAIKNTRTNTLVVMSQGMEDELLFDWSSDELIEENTNIWVGMTSTDAAALFVTQSRVKADHIVWLLNSHHNSNIFGQMETFGVVELWMVE